MRARAPDASGFVERDGVLLHHEVFGDGAPTVMLLPMWSIVHSRMWKTQIPYLARHFRVVTFDGRGCGRSGRPIGPAAYTHEQFAADTIAVLDATGTDTVVLVGQSSGARWGIHLAAEHPGRVLGFVSIASDAPLVPNHLGRPAAATWVNPNSPYWEQDYAGFIEFFIGRMFTEAHSTKPIEDAIGWGLDVGPTTLDRHLSGNPSDRSGVVPGRLRTGVLSSARDPRRRGRRPSARRGVALAEATHGRLVTIAGGGHAPNVRDPVVVNRLIREFVESVAVLKRPGTDEGSGTGRQWIRRARRRAGVVGALRRRRPGDPVLRRGRDRRVADVEGAGAMVRSAPRRRDVRPTRQWPQHAHHRPGRPRRRGTTPFAVATLDAAGVGRVVATGVCSGAGLSLMLAAEHPDRVAGVVAINPGMVLTPHHPHRRPAASTTPSTTTTDGRRRTATIGSAIGGATPSSSSTSCSPNHTRRSSTRTPSSGPAARPRR